MDTTRLWRPEDVAEFMQLKVSTVLDYIHEGELPAYRLGDAYRVAWDDLEGFLQRQRTQAMAGEQGTTVAPTRPASSSGDPQPDIRKNLDFERRALDVLRAAPVKAGQERPFLSAYEIAVKIAQALIAEGFDYDLLGIPIGGKGTGQHRSLSKMVAIYLSSRQDIVERTTWPAAQSKTVDHHGRRITPSVPEVSAFRLKALASPENGT